jgi:hypothetical protein
MLYVSAASHNGILVRKSLCHFLQTNYRLQSGNVEAIETRIKIKILQLNSDDHFGLTFGLEKLMGKRTVFLNLPFCDSSV